MSFCQYCGENNPDNSKFCFRCGKPLSVAAPVSQPEGPEQNYYNDNAAQMGQVPYEEPAYQPPAAEQMNTYYEEPSYQNQMPEQMNVPYGESSYQPMSAEGNGAYNIPGYQPVKAKKNKTPIIATCAIIAIIIITAAVLILTHTICIFHEFSSATCEKASTCNYCDKVDEEALGHDWKDATCTEAKICARCAETEGEALGHSWQGGSCTEPERCSRCNAEGDRLLEHSGEWETDYVATLVDTGSETLVCVACGAELDTRETAKKDPQVKSDSFNFGHEEFVEWLEETLNVSVDYDYIAEDGFISYDIWTDSENVGFTMFEVDSAGEVTSIIIYFDDSSLAGALAILIASEIDPNFAQDDAIEAFDVYNLESFSDSGMTVIYTSTEGGYVYAALTPDGSASASL